MTIETQPQPIYDQLHQRINLRRHNPNQILQFRNVRLAVYANGPTGGVIEIPNDEAQLNNNSNEPIQNIRGAPAVQGDLLHDHQPEPIPQPRIPIEPNQSTSRTGSAQSGIQSQPESPIAHLRAPTRERNQLTHRRLSVRELNSLEGEIELQDRASTSPNYMNYTRTSCVICRRNMITNNDMVVCPQCMRNMN